MRSFSGIPTVSPGPASATAPGYVTTGAQAFAGAKTFTGAVTINQTAGGTETPLTVSVSDDATGKLEVTNGSSSSSTFIPVLKGTSASTNAGVFLWGNGTTDTGTTGVVVGLAQIAGGAVATRPTFTWRNHSTVNMSLSAAGALSISGGSAPALDVNGPIVHKSYTVATVPSASTFARGIIYVSDEVGGATMAFSDGTSWRRVQDRAIVTT